MTMDGKRQFDGVAPWAARITWAIGCLAAVLVATQAVADPMLIDRTVAEVGGNRITLSDVMGEVRDRLFEERLPPMESTIAELYPEALSNLVARQLILLEYERGDAKIPEWYFNQRIERIVEGNFGGDKTRLVAMLGERGISYHEWRDRRRDDAIVATMRQQFIDQGVKARPSDLERIYRERYATNSLPGHVKVSMIMLKRGDGVEDGEDPADALAAEIAGKLSHGGSFAALARAHSLEPHAQNGGSWGYVEPADEFRPELAEAIAALPKGGVSAPIAVGQYLYILRKDDERADLSVPFDAVRDEIEREIVERASAARFDEWVRHLSGKYTVRIYPAQ